MSAHLSNTRIWAAPVFIAVISAAGLTAALLADGWGDVMSWLLLALPVVICTPALWPRRAKQTR
jgi:hypothetical protein